MNTVRKYLPLILAVGMIAGCGQKGPLVLPEKAPANNSPAKTNG
jgi:predicted small lipoprotein YifL